MSRPKAIAALCLMAMPFAGCVPGPTTKTDAQVTAVCRRAVMKGHPKHEVEAIEVSRPRSGGFEVVGRIHSGPSRREFNCIISQDGRLIDLVVNAVK